MLPNTTQHRERKKNLIITNIAGVCTKKTTTNTQKKFLQFVLKAQLQTLTTIRFHLDKQKFYNCVSNTARMEREKKEQKETELSCLRSGIGIKIKSVKAELKK